MSDAFPDLSPADEPTTASSASSAPNSADATATATSGSTAIRPARTSRPLFGTIFWGVILLSFATFTALTRLFPVNLDPTLWLVGSVIVIGLLLVVAGIAAAARRAG